MDKRIATANLTQIAIESDETEKAKNRTCQLSRGHIVSGCLFFMILFYVNAISIKKTGNI